MEADTTLQQKIEAMARANTRDMTIMATLIGLTATFVVFLAAAIIGCPL